MTSADQPVVYLTHEEYAALLAELKILNNAGIVEVAVRNPQVMEYMQHWEGRAEKAEAERDRLRDENEGALAIIATERAEVLKLRAERDRLREAGQAVVDRWDTPLWKEAEATGHVINRLRAALKGDQT